MSDPSDSSEIGLPFRSMLLEITSEGRCTPSFKSAIELLQNSTLIIDDYLDKSVMRNGHPSVFAQYGGEQAVCVGVAMFSEAINKIISALSTMCDDATSLKILSIILSAHESIYIGQRLDEISRLRARCSEDEYTYTIYNTTASFISAPIQVGAAICGSPDAQIGVLKRSGISMGLAYQIRDDVIDIIGETEFTGKPVAGDLRERKMRLPLIHALANAAPKDRAWLRRILARKRGPSEDEVSHMVEVLVGAGSVEYAIRRARDYCDEAKSILAELPVDKRDVREQLYGVIDLVADFDR